MAMHRIPRNVIFMLISKFDGHDGQPWIRQATVRTHAKCYFEAFCRMA
jgi:hypothetical protein